MFVFIKKVKTFHVELYNMSRFSIVCYYFDDYTVRSLILKFSGCSACGHYQIGYLVK